MPTSKLLDETAAAIQLGITKELLYAYVRNAPKKHLGHDRKLVTVIQDGRNFFEEHELELFDKYLWEPWSDPKDKRPEIPSYIKDFLKTEIGGNCPITGKGSPLDNAHISDYHISLSHHHHNLIRIAKDEHTKADSGIIPKEILRAAKEKLIASLRLRLKADSPAFFKSFSPPNPHNIFVGRYAQLSELVYSMEYDRLIVIEGLGGIGKTELLLNAFNNVKYNNPVIWIDIESIASVRDLHIFLQTAVSEVLGKEIVSSIVESLKNEQLTLVLDSLEKLLIIERDEIEDLLNSLIRKTTGLQIIITSQINVSIFDTSKKVIKLNGLETTVSEDLLKRFLPSNVTSSETDIRWIMEFCNGHPLTIKLFSSLIKFHESISESIKLVSSQMILEQPLRKKHTKATSLAICFDTIYNCLSQSQRYVLMYVKCFVGGLKIEWGEKHFDDIAYKVDIAVLKQFFFLENHLDSLAFERISVPNPVKPFLKNKETDDSELNFDIIQTDAIENIMMEAMIIDSYYVEGGTHGPPSYGIHRMEDELANILEAFNEALKKASGSKIAGKSEEYEKYQRIISAISSAVGKFCFTRGYFQYGIMFAKAGITADIALKNYAIAATHYMYLSQIQERQYDFGGQEQTVKELEELAKQTGNLDLLTNSLWARGRMDMNLGNFDASLIAYEKALAMIEVSSEDNEYEEIRKNPKFEALNDYFDSLRPGNIALIKSEIAKVFEFSGRYKEAIPHYQEAIRLQAQYNDETNTYGTLHHLGLCLIEIGETDEGIGLLLETVEGFNRNKQYEYLANSVSVLGKISIDKPALVTNVVFTEEILTNAIESLFGQISEIITRIEAPVGIEKAIDNLPPAVLGKYLYITMFMSFTKHYDILLNHVIDFAERIELKKIKFGFFTSILNLSQGVSVANRWKDNPEEKAIWMKSIYQSCVILNGGPDVYGKTKIFQWLAVWLDRTGIQKGKSPEQLFQDAWNSLEN